jgi:tRNA U34 2-thiouridine synthase MnmA/TrmU
VPAKLSLGPPASSPAAVANDARNPRKTTLISTVSAGETPAVQVWSVLLDAPEEGVAPGQAAVFYDPNSTRVLGGGWIAATEKH